MPSSLFMIEILCLVADTHNTNINIPKYNTHTHTFDNFNFAIFFLLIIKSSSHSFKKFAIVTTITFFWSVRYLNNCYDLRRLRPLRSREKNHIRCLCDVELTTVVRGYYYFCMMILMSFYQVNMSILLMFLFLLFYL